MSSIPMPDEKMKSYPLGFDSIENAEAWAKPCQMNKYVIYHYNAVGMRIVDKRTGGMRLKWF